MALIISRRGVFPEYGISRLVVAGYPVPVQTQWKVGLHPDHLSAQLGSLNELNQLGDLHQDVKWRE